MMHILRRARESSAILAVLLIAGCKEETKVVYRERIAILPDASGLLEKEVRADARGNPYFAILETAGGKSRDLAAIPLDGETDVKFKSGYRGDTVVLYHDVAKLETRIGDAAWAPGRFPIKAVLVEPAKWLVSGTEEGNAIFYAPDKWKAYVEMSRGK